MRTPIFLLTLSPVFRVQSVLYELWGVVGDDIFASWVRAAISDPTFPRESMSADAKADFVAKVRQAADFSHTALHATLSEPMSL